jgi:membrane protease YdiL (CAAX protease family)
MKNNINRKIFFILLIASLVTSVMVLPYALSLAPKVAEIFGPALFIAQIIQAAILFSIAIYFGLRLAGKIGFRLPDFNRAYIKSVLWLSIGMGVLAGVLIILFSLLFWQLTVDFLKVEVAVPIWKLILACFYGGIAEEILLRLFVVSLFVWISMKIKKTADGKPTTAGICISIILSSVLFGLGHLPITGEVTAITAAIVVRAILLNGVPGIIFGWLYWKKGLESAMIAHFSADVVIHVIVPVVATLFIKF